MEVILAIAIGILGGSGIWLVLRPRTFQVLMGLSLLSYAVNLFIFAMGSLSLDKEPIVQTGLMPSLDNYSDPLPQSLVLTAIVIGFATSALFLVVLMASRGLSDTDHVDGDEPDEGPQALPTGHPLRHLRHLRRLRRRWQAHPAPAAAPPAPACAPAPTPRADGQPPEGAP